jgi:hypoxanthine phosphoribosyltransferase
MNETQPLDIEPLFDAEALRDRVAELGRRVGEEIGREDPLVLALVGGSVIFFADLVRAIGRPVRYELIHVDYSDGGPATGAAGGAGGMGPVAGADDQVLSIHYPIPIELEGQSVLLVKDVVTSGVIESYLDQQLRERGARAVRVVALIDKPAERKTALEVDYLAFSTDRAGTLVGYGLKHRGRWGNLPYLGLLAEHGTGRVPGSGGPGEGG